MPKTKIPFKILKGIFLYPVQTRLIASLPLLDIIGHSRDSFYFLFLILWIDQQYTAFIYYYKVVKPIHNHQLFTFCSNDIVRSIFKYNRSIDYRIILLVLW